MILIKVELHSVRTGKITELARAKLCNDGTSLNPNRGFYDCTFIGKQSHMRLSSVRNFPRKSYIIWRLILRALVAAYPEEHSWIGSNITKMN